MRKRIPSPPTKSLTDQQKYLLNRIPNTYDLFLKSEPEPSSVRVARRVVQSWDVRQQKLSCRHKCAVLKAITKAREAVYFKSIKDALRAVTAVEDMKNCGCEN